MESTEVRKFAEFWPVLGKYALSYALIRKCISYLYYTYTSVDGKYWAGWIVESLVSVALSYANSSQPLYIFMRQNMNSRKHFHTLPRFIPWRQKWRIWRQRERTEVASVNPFWLVIK